jgi:hypothetical protein
VGALERIELVDLADELCLGDFGAGGEPTASLPLAGRFSATAAATGDELAYSIMDGIPNLL